MVAAGCVAEECTADEDAVTCTAVGADSRTEVVPLVADAARVGGGAAARVV